jgi:hypothetical protein
MIGLSAELVPQALEDTVWSIETLRPQQHQYCSSELPDTLTVCTAEPSMNAIFRSI